MKNTVKVVFFIACIIMAIVFTAINITIRKFEKETVKPVSTVVTVPVRQEKQAVPADRPAVDKKQLTIEHEKDEIPLHDQMLQ